MKKKPFVFSMDSLDLNRAFLHIFPLLKKLKWPSFFLFFGFFCFVFEAIERNENVVPRVYLFWCGLILRDFDFMMTCLAETCHRQSHSGEGQQFSVPAYRDPYWHN